MTTEWIVAQTIFDALVLALLAGWRGRAAAGPALRSSDAETVAVVEGNDVRAERWVDVSLFPGSPVWAVVLSPTCPRCEPIATGLGVHPDAPSLPIICVVDADFVDTEQFALNHGLRVPVLAARETGLLIALRVQFTPQLLQLDARGAVAKRHQIDDFEDVLRRVAPEYLPVPAAWVAR